MYNVLDSIAVSIFVVILVFFDMQACLHVHACHIYIIYASFQTAGGSVVGYVWRDKETGLCLGRTHPPWSLPTLDFNPFYRRLISSGMHRLTPQVIQEFNYYKNYRILNLFHLLPAPKPEQLGVEHGHGKCSSLSLVSGPPRYLDLTLKEARRFLQRQFLK